MSTGACLLKLEQRSLRESEWLAPWPSDSRSIAQDATSGRNPRRATATGSDPTVEMDPAGYVCAYASCQIRQHKMPFCRQFMWAVLDSNEPPWD